MPESGIGTTPCRLRGPDGRATGGEGWALSASSAGGVAPEELSMVSGDREAAGDCSLAVLCVLGAPGAADECSAKCSGGERGKQQPGAQGG